MLPSKKFDPLRRDASQIWALRLGDLTKMQADTNERAPWLHKEVGPLKHTLITVRRTK